MDYVGGTWSVTGWANNTPSGIITYNYSEDVKSEYLLQWLLYYIKALVYFLKKSPQRAIFLI